MKLLVILQKQLVLWGILQRTELDVIQKSDNNPTLRETKSKAMRHVHTVRVNQHPPADHVGCMVFEQGTPLFHCIPVHIANHGDQLYTDWCWPDMSFWVVLNMHITRICMKPYSDFVSFSLSSSIHNWKIYLTCDNLIIFTSKWIHLIYMYSSLLVRVEGSYRWLILKNRV